MLDFGELPADGVDFERLVREILFLQGYRPYWSGKGPDAGRDLLCEEECPSHFRSDTRTWLIECKHFAGSGKSVGVDDLGDIYGKCAQHHADGYLLVCSTYPSSSVVERLNGFSTSQTQRLPTAYWDSVHLERMLATPRLWSVCQRFLPKSAQAKAFKIFGTSSPSKWVVSYRGFYFHLECRDASSHTGYLGSIASLVNRIMGVKLPPRQQIRIRKIYCDDKGGNLEWTLDYLLERDATPGKGPMELTQVLGDGQTDYYGLGQFINIRYRISDPNSDHFDPDHDEYYRETAARNRLSDRQRSSIYSLDIDRMRRRRQKEAALLAA